MPLPGRVVIAKAAFVSLLLLNLNCPAQDSAPAPLSVEDVVKMHDAGFSDDILITQIRKNGKAFHLNTDEMLDLRKAGLSDPVIDFLIDPSRPYTPPSAPAGAGGAPLPPPKEPRHYPPDEIAAKVPPEPGLYWSSGGRLVRIELKLFLSQVSGGLGKLAKGKGVAYLVGTAASVRINDPSPVFYFRLAEGKGSVEDAVPVEFERKSGRREVEIGPKPDKPELKADAIRSVETKEVSPQLFRINSSKLDPGEYAFFLVGTADPAKGSAGKGYDFGIDAPKPAPKK
jgi:hypothetical protein